LFRNAAVAQARKYAPDIADELVERLEQGTFR